MSEYKVGAVAFGAYNDQSGGEVALRTTIGWVAERGLIAKGAESAFNFRPLVVFDPENDDHIDWLVALKHWGHKLTPELVRTVLRELANPTPPKPEEPTGLGAVVEDAKGAQWVRTHATGYPWHANLDPSDRNVTAARKYDAIDAVRVLSEGVPQ